MNRRNFFKSLIGFVLAALGISQLQANEPEDIYMPMKWTDWSWKYTGGYGRLNDNAKVKALRWDGSEYRSELVDVNDPNWQWIGGYGRLNDGVVRHVTILV